jgi:hypothetical protein
MKLQALREGLRPVTFLGWSLAFGGVIVLVTLGGLAFIHDPGWVLPVECVLSPLWLCLMAASGARFFLRRAYGLRHVGSAILVNIGNLMLLILSAYALLWHVAALPGDTPEHFFAVHRGDYDLAITWLSANPPSHPDLNNFQSLPPTLQYLSRGGDGQVLTTWSGDRYSATPFKGSLSTAEFSKGCGAWTIIYSADDSLSAKVWGSTQRIAPHWFRHWYECSN